MAGMPVSEDIEAILATLRGDAALMAMVTVVDHRSVESGTQRPYVLVFDVAGMPTNTFSDKLVFGDFLYIIRAITQATEDLSAMSVANPIHHRIHDLLDGKKLDIAGYRTLKFSQGQREQSHEESVSEGEVYLHTGFKYEATLAPDA